jgi:CDP-diacylglycerol pyrophosphatase
MGSSRFPTGSADNDAGSWVAMRAITSERKARRALCVALGLLLAAGVSAFDAPARADPMALWRIVHDACVPHFEAGEGPKPCERVDLSGGVEEGVAILKDLVGVAQMLAIPTRRITGIEDPQMLAPDAPKVFFAAWEAKPLVEARLHHALPREAIAIAINSKWARTQDQLHLHVDCVAISVADTLADAHSSLDETWRAMTVPLKGRVYLARRVDSADLSDVAPLSLLADGVEGARAHMDAYSLAAIGATFDGKPGFVLLADQFSLEGGGHAEDLQDHDCAIAHLAP